MQNFQCPPRGPSGIDFTFISIREQFDFLFLHSDLLTFGQSYYLSYIFDHILISFRLLCHFCEVDGLLQLQCHIIIQMNHCHRHILYQEKFMKQQQALLLMEELMEKEKNVHVEEIRIIKQNLEDYAREKQREVQLYEEKIEKVVAKLNSYKQKNQKLNEKIKEQGNTIKTLMENRLKLEAEILKLQANVEKERKQCDQQLKYRSEMKQMMNLQELQIEQVKHQNNRLKENIVYLQKQLATYNQIGEKFLNIQDISQEQYQKQINLLKKSLQHQFCKTTHQIFDCISPRESQSGILYEKDMNRENSFSSKDNIEAQELKKISNYIDYGKTYFQLEDVELSLKESKKVVVFISGLVKQYRQLEQQYNNQRKNNYSLREQLQHRLVYFEDEFSKMGQRQYRNQQTQTSQYSKIAQVVSMNHQLKMKNIEILKIVTFLSKFSIFLFTVLTQQQTKMKYFQFSEAFLFKTIKPKKNKFKSVVYSIIFINTLTKNVKKSRKYSQTNEFKKQNLEIYIKDKRLKNLVYNFSKSQCKKLSSKNHKIEQLSINRSDIRPQQKSIQILSQQSLNEGVFIRDHSSLFSKFSFQVNSRFQ